MQHFDTGAYAKRTKRGSVVILGALSMTTALFLVLPIIQAISASEKKFMIRKVDSGALETPDDVTPEPEPEPEPDEEPPPPQLSETPQLDLSQLQLVLNPGGMGGSWSGGLGAKLDALTDSAGGMKNLFDMNDLDQKPRAIYQRTPDMTPQMRRKAPGKVFVYFTVNENGRVENPRIFKSSDRVFESAALSAVKKWKFDPGKKNGKPVGFRMRVPITFPKR